MVDRPFSSKSQKNQDTSYTSLGAGPYIGIVKGNVDDTRMGVLQVEIPSLGNNTSNITSLYSCQYLSPFYGVKSPNAVDIGDVASFESSQHSYGMWFVPPDIDTQVLVIFAEGKVSNAFWIGCVQDKLINNMIPGIAASEDTFAETDENDFTLEKTDNAAYGTNTVPAGEVNKALFNDARLLGDVNRLKRPIHPFADILKKQGLIQDTVRGTTSSSARRESPSAVFGISTPGRIIPGTKKSKLGPVDEQQTVETTRNAGHTFVLDDGDAIGQNQLVRLRSASGHQILLNDTAGVVYIANGSGKAWMEFGSEGNIDVYSGTGGVNIRSAGDMNFHSDGNINMYAKKKMQISSEDELSIDGYSIRQYAVEDIKTHAQVGTISTKAPNGKIVSYAGGGQAHHTSGRHDLTGSQVHFNSVSIDTNVSADIERTARAYRHDVASRNTGQLITSDPQGNISVVSRMPTHEPFYDHKDKETNTLVQGGPPGATDTVPGTAGFIAQQNRQSDIKSIRDAQYEADLVYEILTQGVTTPSKIKSTIESFAKSYNNKFKIPAGLGIDPVSTVIKDIASQSIKRVVDASKTAGNLSKGVAGTVTEVTDTAKNVVAGKVVSVKQTKTLISRVGSKISSTVKNIGKAFGF